MKTRSTPALATLLCSLACTSASPEPPADHPPEPQREPRLQASPGVPVEPSAQKADPAQPPPTLRVVLEAHGTLSRVGDRPAFGPHDAGFRRLPAIFFGQDAQVEDPLVLPRRDGIFAVGGHWPAPLFAQGAWGDRGAPDNPFISVRFGDTWKKPRYVKGGYDSNQFVFPWRDQSLLAVRNPAVDTDLPPRMGVIAGVPTSPKLAPVLSGSGCRANKVASVAVDLNGPVALSLECRDGSRRLVYWKGDGSQGELRKLSARPIGTEAHEVQPALGPNGAALFADLEGDTVHIQRRENGRWRTSSFPSSGAPLQAAITEHGTWVLTTDAIHRETDDGWAIIDAPGEGRFRLFAGLETGSTWIVRDGNQVWWKDENGGWAQVELPRSPFEDGEYTAITEVIALGPRDAWFEARTAGAERRLRDRFAHAILTTRAAPAPKLGACGYAPGASEFQCDYLTWPAVDRTCSKQLALLIDRHTGAASGNYRALRKSLKASPLAGGAPRFVEAEIGHIKILAAWVESYAQGLALLERAPWRRPAYPRPVCGDEVSLARSELVLGPPVEL